MVCVNVSNLSYTERKRLRADYGRKSLEAPHLLSVQLNSYRNFLYCSKINSQEQDIGLKNALDSIFPIVAHSNNAVLKYKSYSLGYSIFDVEECKIRGLTYSAPLKINVVLVLYDKDSDERIIKIQKEQEVYMGEIPLMTNKGTFVINGIEKVIVSQLHRSPGLFFEHDKGKTHSSLKLLYSSRIIPYRGSWLDFEFDIKDVIYARIDRKKKFPVTILLKALNLSIENILNLFFREIFFKVVNNKLILMLNYSFKLGDISLFEINIENSNFIIRVGEKIELHHIEYLKNNDIKDIEIDKKSVVGSVLSRNIYDINNELLFEANTKITLDIINVILENNIIEFSTINSDVNKRNYIINTLSIDSTKNKVDALIEIYKIMRPGEPSTEEAGEHLFYNLFFSPKKYNLSRVGRMKFNRRIGKHRKYKINDNLGYVLSKEDIINVVRVLIDIKDGRDCIDDIDHLGNRRVKSVGEMVDNQFRIGLSRVEKSAKERLSLAESENLMPKDLISAKPISGSIKEFFNSSQLSQFMDQNNPLSEITHKRRVSALGPGGLTRERAGFEVRDVHITHYGKVCPIETPEGPNIGLINSLSIYSRINSYGFLESPYNKVINNIVTSDVKYLSAIEEGQFVIAQANASLNLQNELIDDFVPCRFREEFTYIVPKKVQYMDVSPKQIVSVAAALIPFLEHNDANRALMGSNMQRQAVPIMKTEKPLVGTGIERLVAINSGVVILAKRCGIIDHVDASRIVVKTKGESNFKNDVDIYNLTKYVRSNQNTCINQKTLVKVGDIIKKNDILADGPSTDCGELALGKNLLVAFMPWYGYNFEDSIVISDKLLKNDVFTSIHIEELTCIARDTKLGPEEITSDIPSVSDVSLSKLDESGIVYIGAEVSSSDILVGKITPKTETQLTPEEKLLRAIFGEKASDVKDTSLRVPNGMNGIVIDVRIFTRDGIKKDIRSLNIEESEFLKIKKDLDDEYRIHESDLYSNIKQIALNKDYIDQFNNRENLTIDKMNLMDKKDFFKINFLNKKINTDIIFYKNKLIKLREKYDKRLSEKHKRLHQGDDLVPGVLKIVKVFLAIKRRIQIGDKMAGRHGNKGVISTIVSSEDMPYLADGTNIDLILNPLGVPSRMNVGQVLETHLGLAAKFLGKKLKKMYKSGVSRECIIKFLESVYNTTYDSSMYFSKYFKFDDLSNEEFNNLIFNLFDGIPMSSPVFDGIKENNIKNLLTIADMPPDGQITLYDGRTGEKFDRKITIGYMYMLKLNHLVDDKMHARSTGSYSLITQQPLGGKAQFGGQRFGEMEVWALEAYGAAYTLQEMLTVKSDDIVGRTRIYKNIVDNNHVMEAGIPESFNVLIKEIRSLGLNIELEKEQEK